jgi:hypothetical protein
MTLDFNSIGCNDFKHEEFGRLQVVGSCDWVTECQNCGRKNLKKAIVMQDSEGNYSFYGSECAHEASKAYSRGQRGPKNFKSYQFTLKGRTIRITRHANAERKTPDGWVFQPIGGLCNLLDDTKDQWKDIPNINEILAILEEYAGYQSF